MALCEGNGRMCGIASSLCAATVGLPLWASVAADNAGLLLVLCNSLWPLCWTIAPPERAPEDVAAARAQEPVVERGNKPPTPTFFGLRPQWV